MTERVISDRDKALLIDVWTTRVREAATWADMASLPDRVIREVVEDAPGVAPARAIDGWAPVPIAARWRPRVLQHEARRDLMVRAVAAIGRAETWEATARSLIRVVIAVGRAFGGIA